nr:4a-hydroxytetrahydrobiopterin dehydratase [Sphingomonas montanisoli]
MVQRHCKVEIVLTTHDVGGLSDADGELAVAIDRIARSYFGPRG